MSSVRKHFWALAARGAGGFAVPRKYCLSGCMPAIVSSTDGSSSYGTSGADGRTRCPRRSKNSRKRRRISFVVIGGRIVPPLGGRVPGRRSASAAARGRERAGQDPLLPPSDLLPLDGESLRLEVLLGVLPRPLAGRDGGEQVAAEQRDLLRDARRPLGRVDRKSVV